MDIPILDFSKSSVVINELFDPDEAVREQFKNQFSEQAISFLKQLLQHLVVSINSQKMANTAYRRLYAAGLFMRY